MGRAQQHTGVSRARAARCLRSLSGLRGEAHAHRRRLAAGIFDDGRNSAMLDLSKALAAELVKDNILVNAVVPYIIDTESVGA